MIESGKTTQSTYSTQKGFLIRSASRFSMLKEELPDRVDSGKISPISPGLSRSFIWRKEYLEALLDNIPYYIFFTDRHHRYIRINKMMAGLLRVSSHEEAVGKGNDSFFSKRVARKMLEEDSAIMNRGRPY